MVNVTASYSPKTFVFEGSKLLLGLCPADSRILYFWYVLKTIHKFIIELHALQCLFVRWSNKKQRKGRIISNFTKGEPFHLLWQPSTLGSNGGNLIMRSPILHTSKKAFLSPSVWAEENNLDTQLKGELTDLFWEFPACTLFPRVGLGWWTLL